MTHESLARHDAAPQRRRFLPWIVGALVATPLVAALTYYMMFRGGIGDYVLFPPTGRFVEVTLTPLPRWQLTSFDETLTIADPPYLGGYAVFWRRGDEVIMSEWVGSATPATPVPVPGYPLLTTTTPSSWTPESRLVRVGDSLSRFMFHDPNPHIAPTVPLAVPAGETLTERLPSGTIRSLSGHLRERDWAGALRVAEKARRRAPEVPILRWWTVSLMLRAGNVEGARRMLAQWGAELPMRHDRREVQVYLLAVTEASYFRSGERVEQLELERHYPAGKWQPMAGPRRRGTPFDMDALLAWTALQAGRVPAHQYFFFPGTRLGELPPMFDAALVHARLMMLRGERERALDVLLGLFTVVQSQREISWGAEGETCDLIYREVAVLRVLEDLCVASTATAADLEAWWPRLEATLALRSGPRAELLLPLNRPRRQTLLSLHLEEGLDAAVADRRREFQVHAFREAVRIRHYRLARGEWPTRDADGHATGLLLAVDGEPPIDPHALGPQPLRFVVNAAGDAHVVGVGPDCTAEARDGARLPSRDEIGPRVPVAPPYDFPRAPGHVYADRAEFDARYPGGCGGTLHVEDVPPILVWHAGPDAGTDLFGRNPQPDLPMEAQYDPTNGIWSDGDIWTWLPVEGVAEWAGPRQADANGESGSTGEER